MTPVGSISLVCKSGSSLNENILNLVAEDCTLHADTTKEVVEGTPVFYVLMANICKNSLSQGKLSFSNIFFCLSF